jgi:membrane-bound lytic murein transglycosylase D
LPNPPPQVERSIWIRELKDRSLPPLAGDYVPRLKQIFAAEKLPPELVWVAEVESSFNPQARSPAGAVGLFQLMPRTARSLSLSLQPEDERLQTGKSAGAAARHLRHLHERFGDWRLALAAYNAGETRVDELLRKYKARTFDAIADHLPAETQMYVPKVEATLRKREGLALDELKIPKS